MVERIQIEAQRIDIEVELHLLNRVRSRTGRACSKIIVGMVVLGGRLALPRRQLLCCDRPCPVLQYKTKETKVRGIERINFIMIAFSRL